MVNKLKAKLNTTAGVLLKYWTISLKLNKYNNKTKKEFSVIYKFRASLNKFRMPWKFRAPQKKNSCTHWRPLTKSDAVQNIVLKKKKTIL